MPIDIQAFQQRLKEEQTTNVFEHILDMHTHAKLLDVHTAIPGIIDSFDPEKQTAKVKPAIKQLYAPDNADPKWQERAVCADVPVIFPGSGDYMLTFPVKQGDECLLIFCERSIDKWYEDGGVQEQSDYRQHHAADAVALVGIRSQPEVFEDFDNDYPQLRNKDGDVFITLNGEDGIITLQAGDDTVVTIDDDNTTVTVKAGDTQLTVDDNNGTITAKADTIKLDGDVHITGDVTGDKGARFQGDVISSGSTSGHSHIHGGVQPGGGTSGTPQ
jgi:phage baseplate assembly protein gpV